ncbi:MAG: hypothetical protein WCD37_08890 [Chloroflexia bacterium]
MKGASEAHSLALEVANKECLVRTNNLPFLGEIAGRYGPFIKAHPPAKPDLLIDLRLAEAPVRAEWEPRFIAHPGVYPLPAPADYDPARDGPLIPYEVTAPEGELRVAAGDTLRASMHLATGHASVSQTASIYLFHTALRQFLAYMLPFAGGCLLHSSGVVLGGRAAGFFGPSGSGKSTIARLHMGPVLTDESLALTRNAGGWTAHATPFWGDYDAGPPPVKSAPLAGLFRLVKGDEDEVTPLAWHSAVRELSSSLMYRLDSPEYETALIETACALANEVPCFTLQFRPTTSIWSLVERTLGVG